MSMFNDIVLIKRGNDDFCAITPRKVKEYASKFNDGHWAFLGAREESKWYQGYATNYGGQWDLRASQMVEDFENSGHPVFRGISPSGRGIKICASLGKPRASCRRGAQQTKYKTCKYGKNFKKETQLRTTF